MSSVIRLEQAGPGGPACLYNISVMSISTHKLVVATDFHYGLGKNSKTRLDILKNYVEPEILKELVPGTTLVICGDLFHEMVSVRTDIYKEARSFLEKCSKKANVILLAGNHDCFNDTTDVTSVELFDGLVNVVRYSGEMDVNDEKWLFLPWSDNNENAFKYKDGTYDRVFCHPDVPREFFSGLYVLENSRRMSATEKNQKLIEEDALISSGLADLDSSDGTENDKAVSNLESVRKVISLAKKGGTIYAGHIHKHSESMIMGRKFHFVGSPYQTTAEEMNTKSGYYVVDNSGERFVEITAPEYVKIRFSDVKAEGVENYDFSKVHNNIVQFDGDDVISVELEARLKRRVIDEKPYEISETDYSNLVMEKEDVKNAEKYEKAFSSSPKKCVDMYIKNLPDDVFEKEKVSRKRVKEVFDKFYDLIDRKTGAAESDGGANIRFKKMVATNFLSYETLEFDFEKYKGLTLVYGKNLDNPGATNACGKSNIIKAIVYALFGRFPKKVKKENMSPWEKPTADVDVTIYLESNGVNYKIESGMTKKSREAYHRVTNLDKNEDLTKKQLAETRKFIENEILHCGFDMFMKTTVLTSSEIFNFYCMKKEDKDDYLNTIFGTKTLNEVREQIKTYLKGNRAEYMEECRLLESKEHDIGLNKTASDRFEENRKRNIDSLKAEMSQFELQIAELKELEQTKDSEEAKKLNAELKEVNEKIAALNNEMSNLRRDAYTASSAVQKDNTTIKLMSNELMKHKDVVPKLCESCKKVVAEGYNLSEYAKTIKTAKANLKENEVKCKENNEKLADLEKKRDELVRESVSIGHKLSEAKSNSGEIANIEAKIKSKKSTMEFIEKQENPNTRIIEALEADKKALEEKVEENLSKIRHLDFVQSRIVSQDTITNLLTSKFIKQLNERIRYYLQKLGLNLGVEFDNDFHYEFTRGDGAHPEFNSLSGGESLRIVIATSFAFKDFLESRRNISSNIRFLDEFFEKDADNLGMNCTISILKDFSKLTDQNVFLISNKLNEIDSKVFDNILVVNIENSRSFVVEETTKASQPV